MKYSIQKWGNLQRNQQLQQQNYDLGSYISDNSSGLSSIGNITGSMLGGTRSPMGTIGGGALKGAAAGMALGPVGALVGGGIGLIGGLISNKKQQEEKKLQEQQIQQQQLMQKQQQMLDAPRSGGGLPVNIMQVALGGYLTPQILAKSGIHINPANKGKFTATKQRTGKSTEELTHSKNPLTRKRAIFAQNAKHWKHELGGYEDDSEPMYLAKNGGIIPYAFGGPDNPDIPVDRNKSVNKESLDSMNTANKVLGMIKNTNVKGIFNLGVESLGDEGFGMSKGFIGAQESLKNKMVLSNDQVLQLADQPGILSSVYASSLSDIDKERIKKIVLAKGNELKYGGSIKMAKGGFVNPLATQDNGLVLYGSGGTHNQNPLGGIPLGQSMSGKQNSVEQGETSFKFDNKKYIFSNRLRLGK
jgi:hypothetical protein